MVNKVAAGESGTSPTAPNFGIPLAKSSVKEGLKMAGQFALRLTTWTASMAAICALGVITGTVLSASALIPPVTILAVATVVTIVGGVLIYRDRRGRGDHKFFAALAPLPYVIAPLIIFRMWVSSVTSGRL
jgi:hypothetical protein